MILPLSPEEKSLCWVSLVIERFEIQIAGEISYCLGAFPFLIGLISSIGGLSLLLGSFGSYWGQAGHNFLVWGSIAYYRAISVRGIEEYHCWVVLSSLWGDLPLGIHCVEVLGSFFISWGRFSLSWAH